MNTHAFAALKASQQSWWYAARQVLVEDLIHRYRPHPQRSLDVGAGFGGMFAAFPPLTPVDALEPYPEAAAACNQEGYATVINDVGHLSHRYDLFGLFDVLEHAADDVQMLRSLIAHSVPDALFVINVPAFPQLWSQHDVEHHHFRRYRRSDFRNTMKQAGLEVIWQNYWNVSLFPIAYLLRRFGQTGQSSFFLPVWQDRLLRYLLSIERFFIKRFPMPWGTSLVAVVKRMN